VPGSLVYLDASAIAKLVVVERESSAITRFLVDWESRVTSRISAVEVTRAVRRTARRELVGRTEALLDSVAFVELSPEIAHLAGRLDPIMLRSLDVVHIASALSLGSDAGPFVTYDARMQGAATAAGLDVQVPA
jgi:uncharacterized protein